MTVQTWHVEMHNPTYDLPKLLHEIRVMDFSLPLVGDYRGNIIAYVAGAYWDDPQAQALAKANAELIASAPMLKAENERLTEENKTLQQKLERLKAQLRRERDYTWFLEDRPSNVGE